MRFENLHAKSVNASAKTFQEEEDERGKMRWGRSSSSRRIESSQAACWLMLIRRLINYQQNVLRGSSSKQRQLQVATGNWQVVATLSGMLRFVVVLTYAMARTKKFTLHLYGCDIAQTSSTMVMMLMRRLGTSEELRRGAGGEVRGVCHY